MVVHTRNSTKEEDASAEEGDARSALRIEHLELDEEMRDDDRDEHLEDALHPHVDNPEPPIVHHRQIGLGVVHEA